MLLIQVLHLIQNSERQNRFTCVLNGLSAPGQPVIWRMWTLMGTTQKESQCCPSCPFSGHRQGPSTKDCLPLQMFLLQTYKWVEKAVYSTSYVYSSNINVLSLCAKQDWRRMYRTWCQSTRQTSGHNEEAQWIASSALWIMLPFIPA